MDVWEEDKYPWLKLEKKYINHAVNVKGLPFLGLCLGHQLLAEALGGEVGKSDFPEVGVMDIQLTEKGATGVFFDDIIESFFNGAVLLVGSMLLVTGGLLFLADKTKNTTKEVSFFHSIIIGIS